MNFCHSEDELIQHTPNHHSLLSTSYHFVHSLLEHLIRVDFWNIQPRSKTLIDLCGLV